MPQRLIKPPAESSCHEDKHKAPTRPHIHPLSLQGAETPSPNLTGICHSERSEESLCRQRDSSLRSE